MPCRCTSIKSSSIFIETVRKFQGITKRYRAAFQKRTCNVVVLKTLGLQKCVKATMLKSNLIFRFFFFLRLWIDILNGIKITGIKQINIMFIFFQKIVCYLVVWNNSYMTWNHCLSETRSKTSIIWRNLCYPLVMLLLLGLTVSTSLVLSSIKSIFICTHKICELNFRDFW